MAYNILKSDNTPLISGGLTDGIIDTTHTSLTLIGKNYAGYGEFLNDNFVHLLENFANSTSPVNPIVGQLWFDTYHNVLKVFSGTSWKISTGATSSPASSPPTDLTTLGGDLWYDSTNGLLKVYSGSNWITVGPYTTSTVLPSDFTGAAPATMIDTVGVPYVVIRFKVNGVTYAVFSKDTFTSSESGFSVVKAGLNFNTVSSPSLGLNIADINPTNNTLVQRNSTGAIQATGLTATSISAATITGTASLTVPAITATTLTSPTITGNLTATTVSATSVTAASIAGTTMTATSMNVNNALAVTGTATLNGNPIATYGSGGTFTSINNTPVGNATPSTGAFTTLTATTASIGTMTGNVSGNLSGTTATIGNILITNANVSNVVITNDLSITGTATLNGNPIAVLGGGGSASFAAINNTPIGNATPSTGAFTTLTVTTSLTPTANATVSLGSPTRWFTNVYGKSMQAQYADLAERFEADQPYEPGTVVELGGVAEITKVVNELSEKVFGVISTNAAYLMNSGAGTDLTHPPVAMSGRVPVRVIGIISKGDRLVSAGNGLARAGKQQELTSFNVIGRALMSKEDAGEGVIEAIVKIN